MKLRFFWCLLISIIVSIVFITTVLAASFVYEVDQDFVLVDSWAFSSSSSSSSALEPLDDLEGQSCSASNMDLPNNCNYCGGFNSCGGCTETDPGDLPDPNDLPEDPVDEEPAEILTAMMGTVNFITGNLIASGNSITGNFWGGSGNSITGSLVDNSVIYTNCEWSACEPVISECLYCGDGITSNPNTNGQSEQCDDGVDNGQECVPSTGSDCTYCGYSCELITVEDDYCIDSITSDYTMTGDLECEARGILIDTEGVTFDCDGHQIIGSGDEGMYGIYVTADDVTVQNCYVENFQYGIYYYYSDDSFAINNTLVDNGMDIENGNGIRVRYGSGQQILENNFENNWYGLSVKYADDVLAESNIVEDSESIGIYYSTNTGGNVLNNEVSGTVSDSYAGIWMNLVEYTNIEGNNLFDNKRDIKVKESTGVFILDNVLVGPGKDYGSNARGIYLYETEDATITGNEVSDFYYNIYSKYGSIDIINDNILSDGYLGLYAKEIDISTIESNNIIENEKGFYFSDETIVEDMSLNRICYSGTYDTGCAADLDVSLLSENYYDIVTSGCVALQADTDSYTCYEYLACGDEHDNDGDGLIDCADSDCNLISCNPDSGGYACIEGACIEVVLEEAQQATVQIETAYIGYLWSYTDLFSWLNSATVYHESGVCDDICGGYSQTCLFANAGRSLCSDEDSEKCTCV